MRPKSAAARIPGILAKVGVVALFSLLTVAVAWRIMVPPAQTATETPPTSIPTLPDATRPVTPTGVWMEPGSDPSAPAWSYDGQYLAFEVPRAFGAVKIQVADVDRDARVVTGPLAANGTPKEERFRLMQRPVWTAAGKVMFEGTLERSAERRLYEANPNDYAAMEVLPTAQLSGNLIDGVDWHGEKAAFINQGLSDSSLFLLDRRQKRVRAIAEAPGTEHLPSFAADGSAIYFSRTLADDDLYRVSVSNGKTELVGGGPGNQERAVPLPGNRVAYYSSVDGRIGDVVLFDGAGTRNIATNVRIPRSGVPSISPDGQWLVWVDIGVPDLLMATAVDSGKTVKIRPGVGTIDSPVIGVLSGRTRVGFLAGDPGSVGVYVADITEALVAPPLRTVDKKPQTTGGGPQ
jgi:hypothetical protein